MTSPARLLRTFLPLAILLLSHIVVHLIVARLPNDRVISGVFVFQLRLGVSEVILLALWLALGTKWIGLRVTGFATGIVVVLSVLSRGYICNPARPMIWTVNEFIFYFCYSPGGQLSMCVPFQVAMLVPTLAIARIRGLRIKLPSDQAEEVGSKASLEPLQFSLAELLITVTGVALSLGILLFVAPYPGWIRQFCSHWWWWTRAEDPILLMGALDGMNAVVVASLALWAVLSRRASWLRTLALIAVASFVHVAAEYAIIVMRPELLIFPRPNDSPFAYIYGGSIILPISVAASLLLVRACGYRAEKVK